MDQIKHKSNQNAEEEIKKIVKSLTPLYKMDKELKSKLYKYGYISKDQLLMSNKTVPVGLEDLKAAHLEEIEKIRERNQKLVELANEQSSSHLDDSIKSSDNTINNATFKSKKKGKQINSVVEKVMAQKQAEEQKKLIKFR